ncbi:MAG: hypothetical protein ABI813_08455 [Bacteroidota bacterium]
MTKSDSKGDFYKSPFIFVPGNICAATVKTIELGDHGPLADTPAVTYQ